MNLGTFIIAADLAEPAEALAPRDTLRRALAMMNARGLDALPVVEGSRDATAGRFAGLLSRRDVLVVYEQALSRAV